MLKELNGADEIFEYFKELQSVPTWENKNKLERIYELARQAEEILIREDEFTGKVSSKHIPLKTTVINNEIAIIESKFSTFNHEEGTVFYSIVNGEISNSKLTFDEALIYALSIKHEFDMPRINYNI